HPRVDEGKEVTLQCQAWPRGTNGCGKQLRSAISSSKSTGLTRCLSKPASCERARASPWPQPVRAMIRYFTWVFCVGRAWTAVTALATTVEIQVALPLVRGGVIWH